MRTRIARVAGTAAGMALCWSFMLLMFEWSLVPDRSRYAVSLAAWWSHFAREHAAAWWLVETFDGPEVWFIALVVAVAAERASSTRRTSHTRVLTWFAFTVAFLLVVAVPVAAMRTFHESGPEVCDAGYVAHVVLLLVWVGLPGLVVRAYCDS